MPENNGRKKQSRFVAQGNTTSKKAATIPCCRGPSPAHVFVSPDERPFNRPRDRVKCRRRDSVDRYTCQPSSPPPTGRSCILIGNAHAHTSVPARTHLSAGERQCALLPAKQAATHYLPLRRRKHVPLRTGKRVTLPPPLRATLQPLHRTHIPTSPTHLDHPAPRHAVIWGMRTKPRGALSCSRRAGEKR